MNSKKNKINIVVSIIIKFSDLDINTNKIKKLVKAVCLRFGLKNANINIVITGDVEIKRINRLYLKHKRITDCISFDLSDEFDKLKVFDIIVNGQRAVGQAQRRGHPSQAELMLYITHGLLHNLGFNDKTVSQAKKMHKVEDEILQEQDYGIIYG